MKKLILITISLLCLSEVFAAATDTEETASGVDRYAVYIGSNKGGKGREQLLYAGSDAQNFQKAMSEIGGVADSNSYILIDPTKESIDDTLDNISQKISTSQSHAKRSEFIFYYSGHSDENSLLLGDIPYDYSELKAAITEVPSDIHVVILDSCYSGNFIRTKGGTKRKPFLIDDSSVVTGHAYLSSSSTNEYSQESDEIESSYFTNAMITGLRGAADTSGDNKVTLNELYSYAFNETLSKTETSKAGPQHPNYNITLVGSGDLVLSDLSAGEAMLSIAKDAKGKFIIRDAQGKLISEINKSAGQPIFMALPAARYSATIIDDNSTKKGNFTLEKDQVYLLSQTTLTTIKRKTNRVRGNTSESNVDDEDILDIDDLDGGDEDTRPRRPGRGSRRRYDSVEKASELPELAVSEEEAAAESEKEEEASKFVSFFDVFNHNNMAYFHLSAFPGLSLVNGGKEYSLVSVGIIGSLDSNVCAIQASSIMNINTNIINGWQTAGIFNIASQANGVQTAGIFNWANTANGGQFSGLFNKANTINGIQSAGLVNVAEKVRGIQSAGLVNYAKDVSGIQFGLINYAETSNGVAIGLINIIKDGMHHVGFNWDSNGMFDFFVQSGTKNLFITAGFSMDRQELFSNDNSVNKTFILYGGLGTEFRFGFSSLDFEFLLKGVFNNDYMPSTREEFYAFNFGSILIPSLRMTFNVLSLKHLDLGLGLSLDFQTSGVNDRAFDYTYHRWGEHDGGTDVYPAIFLGFKIK